MRIGVTGAKGFIGTHLLSALKGQGSVVTLPRRKGLPGKQELKRFVADTDLIFHLGGVNRDTNEEILSGNIIGTSRLLESILNDGKPSVRLVFASSAQVYSWVNYRRPIRETGKANPDTVYGVSKQSAENLIKNSGISSVILRMSNVYGSGCRPNYNSVVPTLCYRAIKGLPLVINGDGQQCRDFVYIEDVVQAFMFAGFKSVAGSGKIFNVSSGRMVSLKQIVKQIGKLHKNTKVKFLMDKKNSEISYCCDSSRFSKKYGWRPRVSLSKGIERTLSYFRRRKRT
ncbi:MAG: NAD-dependent epimerase/dehydratase family protein [Nitrospinae bacterium]|nr:NAD-dependent epimerase/dehydratase family protein [Nitrospinota bacterium]MBL7020004.1 NAD-dependent epimerase/dehydratase family protein [Nitrospinaceae bacterium]